MLKYRLITGPILIAVLIGLVLLDQWLDQVVLPASIQDLLGGRTHPPRGLVLFLVGLLFAILGAVELSAIFTAQQVSSSTWCTALAAATGFALSSIAPAVADSSIAVSIFASGLVAIMMVAIFRFSRGQNVHGIVASVGAVCFAMVYLGLMLGFLLALRRHHSVWWVVGVIAITKSCDTGAYFTGRAIGRHKMIPWLSPGKTWEGLAGGIALAMVVGVALAWASQRWLTGNHDHVPLWAGCLAGGVFAIVGQLGDLTMSLLKRGSGIKDSSHLLPGLGGVLDVLDSPLLVAPVAYWLLRWAVIG